jgi:hypothetical protein
MGFFHNWYRDYDPVTGRFIQVDPIGLGGGLNDYVYANNDPLSWTDPLGLWSFSPDCFRGLPRVSISTRTEREAKVLRSFHMIHPENWNLTPGATFPPGPGKFPVGPDVTVEWWLWEHTLKQVSEYEITTTKTVTTIWCNDTNEKPCGETETLRWNYDDIQSEETKRLVDQVEKWSHKKLYKVGDQPWPIP